MDSLVLIRYFHFVSIFGVVATVTAQHLMLKDSMTRGEIARISKIDAVYGISALLVLLFGSLLWFVVGKPAQYYTSNWIFHVKLTLFILVGLISIIPTVYFLKTRKGDPEEVVQLPKKIIMAIRMELLLLFIIPLLAAMMAYGAGS